MVWLVSKPPMASTVLLLKRVFSRLKRFIMMRREWGFIDRLGKLLIDYTYADATPFKNGHSIVRRTMSKTVGMIDARGR